MREVIFSFYFIDMAVRGERRDGGEPENQAFKFMCPDIFYMCNYPTSDKNLALSLAKMTSHDVANRSILCQ